MIDKNGKCPKDGRKNRPVYITMNNKRTLAVAGGNGHAYIDRALNGFYEVLETELTEENLIDPDEYEFDRGLSGMDF